MIFNRNIFSVEYGNSRQFACADCKELIKTDGIRISINEKYYHLACFIPDFDCYIERNDITINLNLKDTKTFNDGLTEGNSHYLQIKRPSYHPPQW